MNETMTETTALATLFAATGDRSLLKHEELPKQEDLLPVGTWVKGCHGLGIIYGHNKSTQGFYPGNRYPYKIAFFNWTDVWDVDNVLIKQVDVKSLAVLEECLLEACTEPDHFFKEHGVLLPFGMKSFVELFCDEHDITCTLSALELADGVTVMKVKFSS